MKTLLIASLSLILQIPLSLANENPMPDNKPSKELKRMQSLAGSWEGMVDHGNGPMPMTVIYKVTAGGSAVEETIFPDTPQEMVTLYYDKGGKLALTHYCMLQNRPEMVLASASKNELNLQFDPACGIDPKKEAHMNSVKITFLGKNRIKHDWAFFDNGEQQPSTPFDLTRKKT